MEKSILAACLIAAATIVTTPCGALAGTDSGCWQVVNVAPGDSLNMRARPTYGSAIVDRLIPGRHGIIAANGTCVPGSRPWSKRWCPVMHASGDYPLTRGWVKARYLEGSGCP